MGSVTMLEDNDDEAPPPAKPVSQDDPRQGSSRDGRMKKEKDAAADNGDYVVLNKFFSL